MRDLLTDSDLEDDEPQDDKGMDDDEGDTPTPTARSKGKQPERAYSLSGGPWTLATRTSKPQASRHVPLTAKANDSEEEAEPLSPLLTGPGDLLLPTLERPSKRQRVDPARVPRHASLQGPIVHPKVSAAEARDRNQQLRDARNVQIISDAPAAAAPPPEPPAGPVQGADPVQPEETAWPIDGNRRTTYNFTPPPAGGYQIPQGDSVAWPYHGMSEEQVEAWQSTLR